MGRRQARAATPEDLVKRRKTGERHGVILVDKARGPSSAALVAEVGRALGGVRAGHAGTLDPMATGLMVVCVGEATKLATFLSGADKEYVAEAVLGVRTDTLDADGKVVGEPVEAGAVEAIDEAAVRRVLAGLTGPIQQVPPMYSALKREGRPLYELAREGVEVEREARAITVHELELLAFTPGPRATVRFRVFASKGTYVRVLAADLGEQLGVGAHLVALRRTRAGAFSVDEATPHAGLGERLAAGSGGGVPLIPMAEALRGFARVLVDDVAARRVRDGQRLDAAGLDPALAGFPLATPLAVLSEGGARLVAVAEVEAGGALHAIRGFST